MQSEHNLKTRSQPPKVMPFMEKIKKAPHKIICLENSKCRLENSKNKRLLNSVTLNAYEAADVIDDDNFVSVLKSFVIISSLSSTIEYQEDTSTWHLVLAKKLDILPKKAINTIYCVT